MIGRWCANVAYSLGKFEFEPEAIPPKILLNSLSIDVFSQTDLTYLGSPLQTVPPSSTSTCTCAASRRLTTSKWYFSNKQTRTFRSQKKIFFFKKQEYSVQITFRQQWNDYRLAYNDMNGEKIILSSYRTDES